MEGEIRGDGYVAWSHQLPSPPGPEGENYDVWIRLDDGRLYGGVVATLRNIEYLFRKWRASGEVGGGAYVNISYSIIVEEMTEPVLRRAFDELVSSGDVEYVFVLSDE